MTTSFDIIWCDVITTVLTYALYIQEHIRYTHSLTCKHLVIHTQPVKTHRCKLCKQTETYNTHISCQCFQTDIWPAQQEWDWTVAALPFHSGVALL